MQRCIAYSFTVDAANMLGTFLLLIGQDQLGEFLPNTFQDCGSKNTLGVTYMHYILN